MITVETGRPQATTILDSGKWAATRLIDILSPDGRGLIAVLEAYFDESERERGVFCVAGYVFAPEQAKKFCKDWNRAMGKYLPAHMTDLATGGGIYRGMEKAERDALVRKAVAIINKRITIAVGISCDINEVRHYAPSWIRGFSTAYSVCCHMAMSRLGMWLREVAKQPHEVAYVFESGHEHQGEANDLIQQMSTAPENPYCYHSHSFQPKEDFPPLQAADLFAWEWTKFLDETHQQHLRPPRHSLRSLIFSQPGRYHGNHITGEPLRTFMREVTELGLKQMREKGR